MTILRACIFLQMECEGGIKDRHLTQKRIEKTIHIDHIST